MKIEKAIEILQTKCHIEGPFEMVCDELKAREKAISALKKLAEFEDLENQLTNKYNEIKNKTYCDGIENYTTGYKYGHRNGQIELLEQILNIGTGCREEAEKALKEVEEKNEL